MSEYDPAEVEETLRTLTELMRPVLMDGARKRAAATKPHWTVDNHPESLLRHLHRYDRGELVDPDSGAHPMVHVGVRALMIAGQEAANGSPPPEWC